MKPIPLYDETAPIACTIRPDEVPARIELIERMRHHLVRLDRTADGIVLHLPARPDVEADVQRFVVDEKRCCEFWGFAVRTTDDELELRWDAPPAAQHLVDRLERFFRGDEPALDLAGLL